MLYSIKKICCKQDKNTIGKTSPHQKIFTNLVTTTVNKYCSKYNFFINWMK